jgi:cell wall assembly regulator SMI1
VSSLGGKLRRLDTVWMGLGMPSDGLWAPGLTAEQVRQALAEVVEDVPDDVVDWYTWHDGWDPAPLMKPAMAPCFFDPYPLADALEMRATLIHSSATLAPSWPVAPDYFWPPTWLPFGTDDGGGYLAVNLAQFQELSAGVILEVHWDSPDFREPVAASLTDMVDVWLELLPYGFWSWDADEGHWNSSYPRTNPTVPQHLKRRGIVE